MEKERPDALEVAQKKDAQEKEGTENEAEVVLPVSFTRNPILIGESERGANENPSPLH